MTEIIDLLAIDNLLRFLVSLALSIVLGIAIAFVYKVTHKGLNYESSFLSTIVLLAPIVTLVMFFIQGDLVLSLGLVGSLSIIRFRTPIKDTRDMIFLFWTIATGLGIGTLNWTLSMISTAILAVLMYLLFIIKYGRSKHNEYILMISGQGEFNESMVDSLIEKGIRKVYLRSHEIHSNRFDLVYELLFDEKDLDVIHGFIKEIKENKNIEKISLLSPQLNLPM
ncbi:MAG: DUF4956 domain-containing protein [Candidatus Izemoplasmatales bacterium]|uniref:DUF4956 domain-containing protein n=1 Tax=Hujiaoplasma nucleasis TaxID=2725268 RepID=A0A7L6N6C4_9MOLU|nr:DUF4956 domain-containing protein [Hujiaoplasma nucleasis]QLY40798.1 DUF4956 domain-containing protein [Hujiaoplasma nucleasis]